MKLSAKYLIQRFKGFCGDTTTHNAGLQQMIEVDIYGRSCERIILSNKVMKNQEETMMS
jgi:hypothetical protein